MSGVDDTVLELVPQARSRVWGGARLRAAFAQREVDNATAPAPWGELWLAASESRCAPDGRSLKDQLAALGEAFLGAQGAAMVAASGGEFPYIAKLLDTAQWLSIQVHPDDAYAAVHEQGSSYRGKDEAWVILEAEAEAELMLGMAPGTDAAALAALAGTAELEAQMQRHPARPGQIAPVPAGTVHSIGPGLLLYEIQLRSDLTYRLWDFGRDRPLQIEKALAVADPTARGALLDGGPLKATHFSLTVQNTEAQTTSVTAPAHSFTLLTQLDLDAADFGRTLVVGAGATVALTAGRWAVVTVPD